jgi:putative transposase
MWRSLSSRWVGYVAMPEHVHLLVSEPRREPLAVGIQALKLSVSRRSEQRPFWQARYYDFNVFTEDKRAEKLDYMHWNPVRRGLVERMEQWQWSSYRSYCTEEKGRVLVESVWMTHWKPN